MTDNLLSIRHLNVSFLMKREMLTIVDDLNLDVQKKEIVALVGETGCGKSVTGNAILNILPDNARITGSILYKNHQLVGLPEQKYSFLRGREIMGIPQSPRTSLDPLMRVGQQVKECCAVRDKKDDAHNKRCKPSSLYAFATNILSSRKKRNERRARREELIKKIFEQLQLVPADDRMNNYPCELSGGMCQRVLIAMGMVSHPQLLIVDEPTKAIDWPLRIEVTRMLALLRDELGCALLLITHDLPFARKIADRVIVMYAGQIVESGPTKQLFEFPAHPYTQGLIASMPSQGFKPMKGNMPSFAALPSGCRFSDRCPYVSKGCEYLYGELMPQDAPSVTRMQRAKKRISGTANNSTEHVFAPNPADFMKDSDKVENTLCGEVEDQISLGQVHASRCLYHLDDLMKKAG